MKEPGPWDRKPGNGGGGGGGGSAQGQQQQQEQRHKWRTQEEYDAYMRIAHDSVAIGQQTLVAVAGQQEVLDRSEAIVDSNRYMIEKSARTLRGMSWWGSVMNYFSEEPAAPRPRTAAWMSRPDAQAATATAAAAIAGSASAARDAGGSVASTGQWVERAADGNMPNGGDNRRELFMRAGGGGGADDARAARASQAPSSLAEVRRMQDDYLENLGQVVDQQLAIGATLQGALTEQTEQIERLGEGSERLQDQTRAVVRKASRVSQSSWGERPRLHKFVAFRELRTGRFLTVVGGDLRLLEPHLVRNCQFAAYTHQTNVTGLQSVLSRLWLGQNWRGRLGVRGTVFGKNEEWEVDWRRPSAAFLMSCSANWGNGGYLMADPDDKAGGLRLGGYAPEDKAKAALFEIVDCETYRNSDYVNEVLRPLPAPSAGDGAAARSR